MAKQFTPASTTLRDADSLSKMYGNINYDEGAIRAAFNQATADEYTAKRKEYSATENAYYNQAYNNNAMALNNIRKLNAGAVATGASRGVQAASELSTTLAGQQQNVAGATQLAQQRNLLVDQEAAAYSKNVLSAMQQANQNKLALGNLGANLYTADTQFNVGEMQYYAQLDAAAKQLAGMTLQADATRYSADRNLRGADLTSSRGLQGTKYNSDKNLEGTQFNATQNRLAQEYASQRAYEGTVYNADINKLAQEYAAQRAYEGNIYTADKNYQATDLTSARGLEGTRYSSDRNYQSMLGAAQLNKEGMIGSASAQAAAQRDAAAIQAAAMKAQYAAQGTQPTAEQLNQNYAEARYQQAYQNKDINEAAVWRVKLGFAKDTEEAQKQLKADGFFNSASNSPATNLNNIPASSWGLGRKR